MRRIEVLRMPLMIAVMFIHAAGMQQIVPAGTEGASLAQFVIQLGSQELARIAVPLFFAFSGFLFFNSVFDTKFDYRAKLRSRMRRLLIPLLCWNLIVLLSYCAVERVPAVSGLMSGANQAVSNYSTWEWVQALLGLGRPPAAYQLWFIRDLLLFQILSPALLFVLRKAPWPTLLVLAWAWLALPYDASPISVEGLTFYCLGTHLALSRPHIPKLVSIDWRWLCGVYFLAAVLLTLSGPANLDGLSHKLILALGCLALLSCSAPLSESPLLSQVLAGLAGSSFFVFACHEPLLTLVRKVLVRLLGSHALMILLAYFLAVATTLLLCLLIQILLKRVVPRLEAVLSGR